VTDPDEDPHVLAEEQRLAAALVQEEDEEPKARVVRVAIRREGLRPAENSCGVLLWSVSHVRPRPERVRRTEGHGGPHAHD
jgi:hypothetical protein